MKKFNINYILSVLPHGYPFLLVDYIESVTDTSIVAVKNVTYNENFFVGHFSHNPVMPAVLILESLAQASALLAFERSKIHQNLGTASHNNNILSKSDILFTSVEQARFKKMVTPGDVLKLYSSITKFRHPMWEFTVSAMVEQEEASCAVIRAVLKL